MKRNKALSLVLALVLFLSLSSSALGAGIKLPAGLTKLEDEVFYGCASVTDVTVPSGVKSIGTNVFKKTAANVWIKGSKGSPMLKLLKGGFDIKAGTKYRALLIAQAYKGTVNELDGPPYDVANMKKTLAEFTGTPFVCTVRQDLTADGIRSAILNTFSAATQYDVSLFYYSGHGVDSTGDLVGTDTGSYYGYVSPSELRSILDQVPGRKIVIVDACYSGNMLDYIKANGGGSGFAGAFASAFRDPTPAANFTEEENAAAYSKYYVMAACTAYETSSEVGSYSYSTGSYNYFGVFTYALLRGLGYDARAKAFCSRYADANGDGKITFGEAFAYARDETVRFEDEYLSRVPQTPQSNLPSNNTYCPFR
ncbi:MAG: caspase family protein [Clostridia bacterium]|nr:caspase family protein [Clostridia bacterium]